MIFLCFDSRIRFKNISNILIKESMNIPEYYRDLLHPRLHPLGGASSLHAYWNEIERKQNECKEFDMQKFRKLLKIIIKKECIFKCNVWSIL